MGTRADFYVGKGETAEWLGSIAWDGGPDSIDTWLLAAFTDEDFRQQLAKFAATRDDWTAPEQGWPWPWANSRTTDYAYAFDEGKVWASRYGRQWQVATAMQYDRDLPKVAVFPDMSERANLAHCQRSGTIVVSS